MPCCKCCVDIEGSSDSKRCLGIYTPRKAYIRVYGDSVGIIWGFRDIYLKHGESTAKEKGNKMDTGACIDM